MSTRRRPSPMLSTDTLSPPLPSLSHSGPYTASSLSLRTPSPHTPTLRPSSSRRTLTTPTPKSPRVPADADVGSSEEEGDSDGSMFYTPRGAREGLGETVLEMKRDVEEARGMYSGRTTPRSLSGRGGKRAGSRGSKGRRSRTTSLRTAKRSADEKSLLQQEVEAANEFMTHTPTPSPLIPSSLRSPSTLSTTDSSISFPWSAHPYPPPHHLPYHPAAVSRTTYTDIPPRSPESSLRWRPSSSEMPDEWGMEEVDTETEEFATTRPSTLTGSVSVSAGGGGVRSSMASSSVYPLSSSSMTGTALSPRLTSASSHRSPTPTALPLTPTSPDAHPTTDDLSYRLRLLVQNRYYLPSPHPKPLPASLGGLTISPSGGIGNAPLGGSRSVGSGSSGGGGLRELFSMGGRKRGGSTGPGSPVSPPTPQHPHTPGMRTARSQTFTRSAGPRSPPAVESPRRQTSGSAPPSATPGSGTAAKEDAQKGRVMVVRERVPDIQRAAREARAFPSPPPSLPLHPPPHGPNAETGAGEVGEWEFDPTESVDVGRPELREPGAGRRAIVVPLALAPPTTTTTMGPQALVERERERGEVVGLGISAPVRVEEDDGRERGKGRNGSRSSSIRRKPAPVPVPSPSPLERSPLPVRPLPSDTSLSHASISSFASLPLPHSHSHAHAQQEEEDEEEERWRKALLHQAVGLSLVAPAAWGRQGHAGGGGRVEGSEAETSEEEEKGDEYGRRAGEVRGSEAETSDGDGGWRGGGGGSEGEMDGPWAREREREVRRAKSSPVMKRKRGPPPDAPLPPLPKAIQEEMEREMVAESTSAESVSVYSGTDREGDVTLPASAFPPADPELESSTKKPRPAPLVFLPESEQYSLPRGPLHPALRSAPPGPSTSSSSPPYASLPPLPASAIGNGHGRPSGPRPSSTFSRTGADTISLAPSSSASGIASGAVPPLDSFGLDRRRPVTNVPFPTDGAREPPSPSAKSFFSRFRRDSAKSVKGRIGLGMMPGSMVDLRMMKGLHQPAVVPALPVTISDGSGFGGSSTNLTFLPASTTTMTMTAATATVVPRTQGSSASSDGRRSLALASPQNQQLPEPGSVVAAWSKQQQSEDPAVRRLEGLLVQHVEAERDRMRQIASGRLGRQVQGVARQV